MRPVYRELTVAVILLGGIAKGQEPAPETAEEPAPTPLLMEGAKAIGLEPALDTLGIEFSGWLEQSFTANSQSPRDRTNALRSFDDRANAYRLNQLALVVERELSEGSDFDVGGKVELLYGSDARFTHAAGLLDERYHDTLQFDPLEFYVTVRAPIGNGLEIKAGRCSTPLGYEATEAPATSLFSHSYLFTFATPFTHTGVTLTYPLTEQWSAWYGLYRGWDVWIDNNDAPSHLVGSEWTSAGGKVTFIGNAITGPEQDDDESNHRTLFDATTTVQWSEPWSTSVNAEWAFEEQGAADGGPARWWGVAGYATWAFDPRMSTTLRAEYFVDQDGSLTDFPADLTELTFGLDLYPFESTRNVRVRPEVRWDHAIGDQPFDDGTRSDQFTFAVDLILSF